MIHVLFETTDPTEAPSVDADADAGTALVDLCDERNAPVPFSCRSASCGTCRIDVLAGGALLEPPRDEELDILDIFGDDPSKRRLACQARLGAGEGLVHVRAVQG